MFLVYETKHLSMPSFSSMVDHNEQLDAVSPAPKKTLNYTRTHTNLPPPPPTKTNTYFHHITPEVSRVHIEFPSPVWLCLWQVITYWMLFLFIHFLEREIHLLHGETVSRNFIFYFQAQTLHVLSEPSRTGTIIHWFIEK